MTTSYTDGTVTVTNGSATVTGNGTGWETANVSPGFFGVDGDTGNPVPVATIVSDTEMTLVTPWRGDSGAGLAYWLSYDTNDGQQTVNNAVRLSEYIARLDSEALSSIAALTPSAQRLIMFTGPNTATLIDRGDLGFSFDEQVPTLAERAAYDSAPADFVVLVIDNGDGRSAFYTKLSSASGDWSMPAYVTGPTGETGPVGPATEIQVGTVTTLPAGSSVTVVEREVSPGVVALDFGIPKGADGTGTGDVVGPAGGVANNFPVAFDTTTGKLIKAITGAIAALHEVTPAADKLPYFTGTSAASLADLTAFARTILDDANGAAMYATMGATKSLASSGWEKKPDGTIEQWGLVTVTGGDISVTLPMAFPNAILGATANALTVPPSSTFYGVSVDSLSLTSIALRGRFIANGGSVGQAGVDAFYRVWGY